MGHIYIRANVRLLEGKQYNVIDIGDADYKDINIYEKFLKWCISDLPISIFIETGEHKIFRMFGRFISGDDDITPNTYNLLSDLNFKRYEKDGTMFYYIK